MASPTTPVVLHYLDIGTLGRGEVIRYERRIDRK